MKVMSTPAPCMVSTAMRRRSAITKRQPIWRGSVRSTGLTSTCAPDRMDHSLGFIGLGKLGLPIAQNLVAAGFALRVYNRTAEKAAGLVASGATVAISPAETAVA